MQQILDQDVVSMMKAYVRGVISPNIIFMDVTKNPIFELAIKKSEASTKPQVREYRQSRTNTYLYILLNMVSNSSTFYQQLFCTKLKQAAFMFLKFRFFCHEVVGRKAAGKIMLKLTDGQY
jgi:hypothetical protein